MFVNSIIFNIDAYILRSYWKYWADKSGKWEGPMEL